MITTEPFVLTDDTTGPMPRIKAFQAIRPPARLASQVASVPYDIVNRAEAAALAEGNPHSFLHVIRPDIDLPPDTNPYDDSIYGTAAANLAKLMESGALAKEPEEKLFLYRQTMDGQSQVGLVCCSHVDDYENNRILKHEKTRKAKEDDRTRHIIELNAHAGPVFLTYRDVQLVNELVETEISNPPEVDFIAPDGVQHSVWSVQNVDSFVAAIGDVPCTYVADGHHRAASAWRAAQQRKEQNEHHTGSEEYNWFLTVLFPASQLKILAYNRVVKDLNGLDVRQLLERLRERHDVEATTDTNPASPGSCCLFVGSDWYRVRVPSDQIDTSDPVGSLDVALLEDRILRPILGIQDVRTDPRIDFVGGIRGTRELERLVDSGNWACAFSMYPTSIEQLLAVADAGAIMPPKSTWFEPKLRSGLFVHMLD